MFVRLQSFVLEGIDALPVQVEVDVSNGLPAFDIVGLPDAAVRESRERVRAAIKNGGWDFPARRITVNLAPAHTRKAGPGFDLAIALGVLAASGQVDGNSLCSLAFVGELALDGALRPVRGALAIGIAARSIGCQALIVPAENGSEAVLAGGVVLAAAHLGFILAHLAGMESLPSAVAGTPPTHLEAMPDLADVRGQPIGRRALEVAAAGAHNLIMTGPPGAGKSLLARCLPSILPPLDDDEALDVSRIHSVAGVLNGGALIRHRPYRAPHHSASRPALLGGGQPLRPGEITLAHRGVLFLDEVPEFRREVLEGLRQPLEEGQVRVIRAHGSAVFPAELMLVAAANPCPCGYFGDSTHPCTCAPALVQYYHARLSGPLLDRFDIQLRIAPLKYDEMVGGVQAEPSELVRERVREARSRQRTRLSETGLCCNAQMGPRETRRYCRLSGGAEVLLRQAAEQMRLSMRGHDRVLKVARTVADLARSEQIETNHLAEALQYRRVESAS